MINTKDATGTNHTSSGIIGSKNVIVLILWLILVISDTVSQLLLKIGAVSAVNNGNILNSLIVGGYGLYVVSFITWMLILKTTRLLIALSTASVLFITVAYASHHYIGEKITNNILIGTVLISIGVLLLGLGEHETN